MHIRWFIIASVLFTVIFATYVHHHDQHIKKNNSNKLSIVCTTNIIADAAQEIGDTDVAVHSLMGPGVDPHLYRAREGDVHRLINADLILYHGLHLEGKMSSILKKMSAYLPSVAVTQTIPTTSLIESEIADTYDPHIWHNVSLWSIVVQHLADTLSQVDPQKKDAYQKRATIYLKKLQNLEQNIITKIKKLKPEQRILVTAHDAFSYFGKKYGFTVVGLQGISTQSEIGTRDVQSLAYFIVEKKIPALFLESSTPPRNIQAVQNACQRLGWNVIIGEELFSDSLDGKEKPAGNYIGMIQHNLNAIVSQLQRNQ